MQPTKAAGKAAKPSRSDDTNVKHLLLLFAGLLFSSSSPAQQVIAHRGAWKSSAQNSLASLREAIRLGCYGSEFDVHLSADSIPVVSHDHEIGGLSIEKSTWKQLSQVRLANGERLPTLEEYLREGLRQRKTKLILEIKVSREGRSELLTAACVALVRKLKARKQVEYISFGLEVCRKVRELDPRARVFYLNGDIAPDQLPAGISPDYPYPAYEKHPDWLSTKRPTNVWTVNDGERMRWFIDRKVRFITTDEPERLLQLLRP